MKEQRKGAKTVRRMKPADVNAVLREIAAWANGEREGPLTWQRLVQFSGFSRQSLWAKETIRAKFDAIKRGQRGGDVRPLKVRTVDDRIAAFDAEIGRLKRIINRYDELWARIEYNAGVMGLDPEALRRPLRPLAREVVRRGRPRK